MAFKIPLHLLAYHYTEAGLNEQAVDYWHKAGQKAIERSANVEAIRHLTIGLALLKTLPNTPQCTQQELDIRLILGPALQATRGFAAPEVEQSYVQACVLCQQVEDTPHLFPVLLGLWRVYLARGEIHTARELGEQCLTMAQRLPDSSLLLWGYWTLGQSLFFLGDFASARTHLEQAIALYDPQQDRSSSVDPRMTCLSYVALALWFLAYPHQALMKSSEALTCAHQLDHPFTLAAALNWNAIVHHLHRDVHTTKTLAETVITLSIEQDLAPRLVVSKIHLGWVLAMQGQCEQGIEQIRQGLTGWQISGAKNALPFLLSLLAETYEPMQQSEEGLTALAEALALVDNTGEGW